MSRCDLCGVAVEDRVIRADKPNESCSQCGAYLPENLSPSLGDVYRLRSRNLALGVYDGHTYFTGVRLKFGRRFLANEVWNEPPGYGTATPVGEPVAHTDLKGAKLLAFLMAMEEQMGLTAHDRWSE